MAGAAADLGFGGTSVELVVSRAGVSRRTFYRFFGSREECFGAVLEMGLEQAARLVRAAFARERSWRAGTRSALGWLLAYLDSEPELARVWLVESLAAGRWALEQRERNVAALQRLVLASRPRSQEHQVPPLAVEGVTGAVLWVVQTHIVTGEGTPLIELLGPLMGLATRPYLPPSEVEKEIQRGRRLAREIRAGRVSPPQVGASESRTSSPARANSARLPVSGNASSLSRNGAGISPAARTGGVVDGRAGLLPVMLENPNAHRARECLLLVSEHPGLNNSEVGGALGVGHKGQVSRLLNHLGALGLLEKHTRGLGYPTTWRVTPEGEWMVRVLRRGAADFVAGPRRAPA